MHHTFFCSLPLDFDTGDESNENDIESIGYDSNYVCQSDHYFDPITGAEKISLRGIKYCEELNVINHRIYCCNTDHCNKWLPPMTIQTTFIYSNDQQYLPSMILTILSIMFQYFS
ncbi:unnamed protein product [Rotaria sp. Silwood2]|nr:unnamed protein product [Rotaria sp. Silwood2]CAF2765518.1 unnamed protein product [Rotaria sp. Silwood2]CAF3182342.1 unnamed protein product [Rotaria sp. Silwood2]CAF4279079.1 unnamed protein product [Rotaria sp. Silwood2]CAF4288413.1 unnamed protein product [Rotaria sp. Silwood2]